MARRRPALSATAVAAALLVCAAGAPPMAGTPAPAAPPVGDAQPMIGDRHSVIVFDGDTIQIGSTVIELAGIDAPELGQRCGVGADATHCGLDAAYDLRKRLELAPQPVRCWAHGGVHDARVATCLIGEEDLSQVALANGQAVAAPGAPVERRIAEERAKRADLGIWRGPFVPPWQWRRDMQHALDAGQVPPGCVIKGVIGPNGGRRYYGPLDQAYADLPAPSQHPLCSEDGARAAGWRRPGEASPR